MPYRLIVSVAAACVIQAGTSGQQRPPFHAETRLVILRATVRNNSGDVVANLDRSAFTVYEDGRRQPITLFLRDDVPVSLGLLIDNSGSMRPLRAKVEAAALAFARASNAADEMFVVNFADKVQIDVPFTSNLSVLEAGIARVDSIGGTALRDAVDRAADYLTEHGARDRKVLLVITDGNDNASMVTMERIRREAQEHDMAIFAVGLFGDGDPARAKRGRRELSELTERTGGHAYYPDTIDHIDSVVLDVASQIRNQYTIAYAPQNQALDGSYRQIRVTATGSERLSVQTRAGYLAIRPD